jgi:protein-S-isoprenylcysteine O-methyltransferase Ste14
MQPGYTSYQCEPASLFFRTESRSNRFTNTNEAIRNSNSCSKRSREEESYRTSSAREFFYRYTNSLLKQPFTLFLSSSKRRQKQTKTFVLVLFVLAVSISLDFFASKRRQKSEIIMGNNSSVMILSSTPKRIKTAIWAPPVENPDEPHLTVGLIGGDIPVFPPISALLLMGTGALGWYYTGNRMRYLPALVSAVPVRATACALMMTWAFSVAGATQKALKEQAETEANFAPVKRVADTGPYAYSRNMMYVALLGFPVAFSLALDTAWLLGSTMLLGSYLDLVVVRAEEKFLKSTLGKDYEDYCKRVPRWY